MAMTEDLSDGFFRDVQTMSSRLGCNAEDASKVWFGKLTSAARSYQVNFLPATLNTITTPAGVLAAKGGVYSNFHAANPALDVGKKGFITLDDLRKVVESATTNNYKRPAIRPVRCVADPTIHFH